MYVSLFVEPQWITSEKFGDYHNYCCVRTYAIAVSRGLFYCVYSFSLPGKVYHITLLCISIKTFDIFFNTGMFESRTPSTLDHKNVTKILPDFARSEPVTKFYLLNEIPRRITLKIFYCNVYYINIINTGPDWIKANEANAHNLPQVNIFYVNVLGPTCSVLRLYPTIIRIILRLDKTVKLEKWLSLSGYNI